MRCDRREFMKTAGIVAAEAVLDLPVSKAIMSNAKVQEPVYSNLQELAQGRKLIDVGANNYEYSSEGILYTPFQNYRITNNAIVLLDNEKPLGVIASITNSYWFNRSYPYSFPHMFVSRLDNKYPIKNAEELHDPLYRESMVALHIKNKDSTLISDSEIERMLKAKNFKNIGKIYLDARETRQHDIALDVDNRRLYIFSSDSPVMIADLS